MRIAEAVLVVMLAGAILFVGYGSYQEHKSAEAWRAAAESWERVYRVCEKTTKDCVQTLGQADRALDRCGAALADAAGERMRR